MTRVAWYALGLLVGMAPGFTGYWFRPEAWYFEELRRPSWNPPAWIFGPVWTTLYVFMGIVLTRLLLMRSALADPHSKAWTAMTPAMGARVRGLAMTQASVHVSHALVMFGIQWVFNALWSPLFFGMKSPMLGLVDIALLWLTLRRMIPVLWRIDRFAAGLFIPYFAWVSFATALNAAIVQLN